MAAAIAAAAASGRWAVAFDAPCADGRTPLYAAAANGHFDSVHLLCEVRLLV